VIRTTTTNDSGYFEFDNINALSNITFGGGSSVYAELTIAPIE
jgi:hypothetical protein